MQPTEITLTDKAPWHSIKPPQNLAAKIPAHSWDLTKENMRDAFATDFSTQYHYHMELVQTEQGVKYVNDSSSCNVNAVWFALQRIAGPVAWIAGGITTQQPHEWDSLTSSIQNKVTHIIAMGVHCDQIVNKFWKNVIAVVRVENMAQAVYMARLLSNPGHTVLLSPGMASFDMFSNLAARGEKFRQEVLNARR